MKPGHPDEPAASGQIVAANLRAAAIIYSAAMLEELRLFQVADRIAELFGSGQLPIGRSPAGQELYQYWRQRDRRLTADERAAIYAGVLGTPGDDGTWRRLVAAVVAYAGGSGSQDDVRSQARALAADLSRRTAGLALHAAPELQGEVQQILRLLGQKEIQAAFGAADVWQTIERVATAHLGNARNMARYRALAQNGATIIRWLAGRAGALAGGRPARLLDDKAIARGRPGTGSTPSDYDLVTAAEAWLAASVTADRASP